MTEHRPSPSTLTIYRRVHQGDLAALENLLTRVRPRITNWVAARLGPALRTSMEVDDIVQETLIRAHQAIKYYQPGDRRSFYRWLFTIAKHTVVDCHRKIHRAKRDVARNVNLDSSMPQQQGTPSQEVSYLEQKDRILWAIASLPEKYRRIIRLRIFEKFSTEEAAERMGITPNNASVMLVRARQALKKSLGVE